jgi:UDP-2,3-diacylglucosamine hydrolase
MKAVFFSDAHLAGDDAARVETLKGFIKRVTEDADLVVVLGDLFEFYHGYEGYIYPPYREIVDLLRDVASGRSAYFVEGNHEFGMGRFFESYTGIRCVTTLSLNLDDKRVFLSHGDTVPRWHVHRLLKSRFVYAVMDHIGPERTWRIAMVVRRLLSGRPRPRSEKVLALYRKYGGKKLAEGYDAVILAHSHLEDLEKYESNGAEKTYMNTGNLIASYTYGEYITGKGFALKTYDRREL